MQVLEFENIRHALFLGAHSDDIEIGCLGTLLRLKRLAPDVTVDWVVFTAAGEREQEARESAEAALAGTTFTVSTYDFRDGFLPYRGADVKNVFEELKQRPNPDVIFTHTRDDRHQDHRLVNELTWNTWRNHLILEYEIPKWDGDFGRPNVFSALDPDDVDQKVEHLLEYFATQRGKHWFGGELFRGVMRVRGMECGAEYAEAFYGRKLRI